MRRRVVAVERETTGWGALTVAELAVSDLAAEGMTNKQIAEKLFVSPHTVNTHLRHVFEKLGLRSHEEAFAKEKIKDLNAFDEDHAARIIAGTARSMGITVEG